MRLERDVQLGHIGQVIVADQDDVALVNECQIEELQKAGKDLTPDVYGSCEVFSNIVRGLEAAVIHTYRIYALRALREADPAHAAEQWKQMVRFCERTLNVTSELRDKFPHCGTPNLYNVALEYREQAQSRYLENLHDSECQTPPDGLFPKVT